MDYESATARTVMRNAIHNIAYTTVNSNAMQGVAPGSVLARKTAAWKYIVVVVNIVLVALSVLIIFSIIRRTRDEKD